MGLFKKRLQAPGLCRLNNCNNSERSSSRRFIKTSNEAPYQMLGRRSFATILGYRELYCGHFWLSLISECISCYLYVFIVCSTRISWTGSIIGHEPSLLAMSLSSGIAMMLLIFTFRTVHVNPALTLSFLLTGRIPILRALFYLIVHCLGSVAAIAFLYSISVKGHAGSLGLDNPHELLASWQIMIVEVVISFVVTLATYATCNYSSYAQAKKYILEQLGQSNLIDLFPNSNPCDNQPTILRNHTIGRNHTIAPLVPQLPTTSITLQHGDTLRGGGHIDDGDLMNSVNNHSNDLNQTGGNIAANNNKPYLISNHYNQVYDQYNDVLLNPVVDNLTVKAKNDNNMGLSQDNNNARLPYSNDDMVSKQQPSKPTSIFAINQTMKNSIQPVNFNSVQTKGYLMSTSYPSGFEDNVNYDYEYDNHRIYATQQLKSSPDTQSPQSQVPLEEIMQNECQLLAPNGFSLNVTNGQALVIGLAYTLTSLSGIPASGASLNPARSFGPAFIMNQWDGHWIYWVGPILGAVIAGFFYEFVFNPTRKSSLCYHPKLFRFSAQDMAKVGSKSRLYQQQHHQQRLSLHHHHHNPSSTIYRPKTHLHTTPSTANHHSPTSSTIYRPQQAAAAAHLQRASNITGNQHHHSPTSSASRVMNANGGGVAANIISNSASLLRSSTRTIGGSNNNGPQSLINPASMYKATTTADHHNHQVLYDDPSVAMDSRSHLTKPKPHNNPRPSPAYLNGGLQQRFEFLSAARNRQQLISSNDFSTSTTTNNQARPRSMAAVPGPASFRRQPWQMETSNNNQEQLDDDLYNVLSESLDHLNQQRTNFGLGNHMISNMNTQVQMTTTMPMSMMNVCNEVNLTNSPFGDVVDYANQATNESTSDSSQRTSEMLPTSSSLAAR